MAPVIAIIGALEKEVRQIYAAVEKGTVVDEAGLRIVGGEYHGFEIVATTAGMGTVNAAAAAQHLISAHGANAIIFSGIAGGLNPALHICATSTPTPPSSPNPRPASRNSPAAISSSSLPSRPCAPTALSMPRSPRAMQQPPGSRPTPPSSVATTPIPSRSASCAARSPRATAS